MGRFTVPLSRQDAFGVLTQTSLNRTMTKITWDTYAPYSLGFNETFSRLEALAGGGSNYPPHNVVYGDDGRTILEVALAGFAAGDIEVATERNVLTISAKKAPPDTERQYQHKGISYRTFARNWQMADDVDIESVEFVNGLLSVVLIKEIPEKQKRKKHF